MALLSLHPWRLCHLWATKCRTGKGTESHLSSNYWDPEKLPSGTMTVQHRVKKQQRDLTTEGLWDLRMLLLSPLTGFLGLCWCGLCEDILLVSHCRPEESERLD